jgi:hypothetical protein
VLFYFCWDSNIEIDQEKGWAPICIGILSYRLTKKRVVALDCYLWATNIGPKA